MSARKKVLITDRFSQEALMTLQSLPFLQLQTSATPQIQPQDLSGVHGLIIRSRTQITEEHLKAAKDLQVIITATSGFDHIDLKACQKWGISTMFTPDANIESAAQLTWSLVLSAANNILQAHKSAKAGTWKDSLPAGLELNRKTYGIIGLGRIGSRVAEIANAFNMTVVAYDPYADEQQFRNAEAERLAFEEVLKRSDVVSFHVPATEETHNMLNRSNLEYANRGLIIINTSRGQVISEMDLCDALSQGWVGFAGLDVFEKEPLPRTSRLLNYPNVILTPHIGAYTNEAFQKASDQAALKLTRFFMDGSTTDTLPPKAAWYGAPVPYSNNKS